MAASPASAATTTVGQAVPGSNQLIGVACSSATACVAIGYRTGANLVVPITNGVPGAAQVVAARSLEGVACYSATTCVAVGSLSVPRPPMRPGSQGYVVTITNGIPGTPVAVPAVQGLSRVACSDEATCYALGAAPGGAGVVVTLTNGVAGAVRPISGPYGLDSLTCPSHHTCYGVGRAPGDTGDDQGVVVPITDGLAGAAQFVPGSAYLGGVACSTASTCYATGVADDFFTTLLVPITDGILGQGQPVPDVYLGPIACMSESTCEALGFSNQNDNNEALVVPIVHGVPGAAVTFPGTNQYYALGCASAATCVAAGSSSASSIQQGVVATINENPHDADACRKGGWKLYSTPAFANQGDCVSFVKHSPAAH